jgi:hypothetical protein
MWRPTIIIKRKRKSPFAETTDFPTQISPTGISNDDVDNTDTDLTSKLMTTSKIDKQSAYTDKFFNGVHSAGAASDPTQNKYKSITGDMVGELLNHNNMKPFSGKKSHESYSTTHLNQRWTTI